MPDYTQPQWQEQADTAARAYGINPAIFSGLIEQESSWNPTAKARGSSAFGFTQLTRGAAQDVGVNRFDPTQNLQGGAAYLKEQLDRFGGDYTKALSAYNQGAGNVALSAGKQYAASVLDKAKHYGGGAATAAKDATLAALDKGLESVPVIGQIWSGAKAAGVPDIFTASMGDCGINPICYLQKWLDETHFVARAALFILATILIIGGIAFLAMGYRPTELAKKALA